jgi:hypothetical protein
MTDGDVLLNSQDICNDPIVLALKASSLKPIAALSRGQ